MDLDDIADELYQLHPSEFVAARDERVRAERRSQNADLARAIAALRRPSTAAWVVNRCVRAHPADVDEVRELGDELRRAYHGAAAGRVRELTGRRQALVARFARRAGELAEAAGHAVGASVQREVEETVHAALADPDAARAFASGRLERPLRPAVGFTGPLPAGPGDGTAGASASGSGDDRRTAPPAGRTPATTARTPRPPSTAPADDEAARERELRRLRRDADTAREAVRAADGEVTAREREAADLRDRLAAAETAVRNARDRQNQARLRLREAEAAVDRAGRPRTEK